jgi:hypothetical protein
MRERERAGVRAMLLRKCCVRPSILGKPKKSMNEHELKRDLEVAIRLRDLAALKQALHIACGSDRLSQRLLDSAMRQAIVAPFPAGAMLLLESGASAQVPYTGANAPLYEAAAEGAADLCAALLERGAQVDELNRNGNSALLIATARGRLQSCRVLIERGADVNVQNKDGTTPLGRAVNLSDPDSVGILRLLMRAGASRLGAQLDRSLSAFQLAVRSGVPRNAAFFIDECGEDPLQTTADGRTMFELANDAMKEMLRSAVTERLIAATQSARAPCSPNQDQDRFLSGQSDRRQIFGAL